MFTLQILPLFVMEIMGRVPGLPGLFIAAVFSGSLRYSEFICCFMEISIT